MTTMLESVLKYHNEGFSVIPMSPKNKSPLVKWTEFQKRLPTESELESWWKNNPTAMCAIVTGSLSGCCAIDGDSKKACAQIEEMLPDSFEGPIAQTPRGGRHYYFRYPTDMVIPTTTGIIEHVDVRGEGGCIIAPPSVNASGKCYSRLNGLELSRNTLPDIPARLLEILAQRPSKCATPREHHINNKNNYIGRVDTFVDTARNLFVEGKRDDALFHLALALRKSGQPQEYILQVLINIADTWGEGDKIEWLQTKVESAFCFEDRKEKSLAEEIRQYVLSTNGVFLSTDVHKNLDLSTRAHKKNCSEVLGRLIADGVIERYGNKDGCFRRIEKQVEIIDFINVSTNAVLDIKLPFQIENYVKLLPKNIIAVAGEPNSGKTAFLLNVVRQNMQSHDIYYFSSEMGPLELQGRLTKFDMPLENWKCKFVERSSNFADVIRPDAINIIDFLEIHDEFYKISGLIKDIFDRLNNGVAFIAIQKNRGTDCGLGGMRSLEKPRLYLAMEPNKIKIIKGKNWANAEVNPNGLELDFKLVQGCKFIPISGWKRSA